ncbi:hypothetical protein ACIO3O_34570 [Streptomyces sp. NPDC087440]|uniref:hypothetical protein n=1 Tax=Streptomyces sp. NPDC087440 TaxID=3365790 RepID=UPI003803BCDD
MRFRPAPHVPLAKRHIRVLSRYAQGDNGNEAARALGLKPTQVYDATSACSRHLGVSSRCALVHAAYLLGVVPRPGLAPTALPTTGRRAVDDDATAVLELLAMGMTHQQGAEHLQLGLTAWWLRITSLQQATEAVSTHHLITIGWQHGVLGPTHVHMTGNVTLTPAAHLTAFDAALPAPRPQLASPTSRAEERR